MSFAPEILKRLLEGGHLNVEERRHWGITADTVLKYSDLVLFLSSIIRQNGSFPEKHSIEVEGNIREGIVIERKQSGEIVCRCQRTSPSNPHVLIEQSARMFANATDAADFYLKWELNLPGLLDSITVVK